MLSPLGCLKLKANCNKKLEGLIVTELSIRELLASGIIDYKETNPSVRSFKFISDRANVSESFLKRIARGDETVSCDPSKFLSIAKVVLPEKKRKFIVTYFYDNVFHEHLEELRVDPKSADINDNDCNTRLTEEFENMIIQDDTLLVYSLASHEEGVEFDEIKSLGERHVRGLTKLLDAKLVFQKKGNERYYAIKKDWTSSFKNMNKKLRIYSSCYKNENYGKKRNFAISYTFGVNQEGIDVLQSKMSELANYIYDNEQKNNKSLLSIILLALFIFQSNISFAQTQNIELEKSIHCTSIYNEDTLGCLLPEGSKSIILDDISSSAKKYLLRKPNISNRVDQQRFQDSFNLSKEEAFGIKNIYKLKLKEKESIDDIKTLLKNGNKNLKRFREHSKGGDQTSG